MKLVLSVISQTGAAMEKISLDQQSATIGRAQDNTLVLEDPKRYISSHHAVIDYRSPDYYLTDTSTNGVIINDATQPLGKGNSVRLNDGDRLHVGDYTLSVTLLESASETAAEVSPGPLFDEQFTFEEDPFAELGKDAVQEMIDENQLVPEKWQGSEDQSDHVLDFPSSDETTGKKEKEEVEQPPAYKEAFEPFQGKSENKQTEAADIFAEDWFLDKKEETKPEAQDPFAGDWLADKGEDKKAAGKEPLSEDFFAETKTSAEESRQQKEPAVTEDTSEQEEAKRPSHQIPSPPKPAAKIDAASAEQVFEQIVQQFLLGAGLEGTSLQQALTPETFYIVGKILRASVQGTLDVLIGRAKIKNEMHLDVTMIRSKQNNPIKFSVSAEEAIKKLLAPQDSGYLSAEDAIEEAFDDIKAHQYSVIAGMQTALLEVLKRFDPQKLENRLQEESPISASIPIHKQAKLWRLFEHLYKDIEHEATDNFYHLFGQAFAETYQQQINQLKSAKKETPF
ncbi:type VI secretion system-associated FHA domain protein TagH [Methylomarinum vadi]|uniref:type VI secretion system-associated FHA domain protein TagH n=1 Tax=Methylomarinum vadi TaxID=438855 RepID=UPI0013627FD4|nr:type VI secretion system-associated FHA domain protein TagH [Methylomarinum vadi]